MGVYIKPRIDGKDIDRVYEISPIQDNKIIMSIQGEHELSFLLFGDGGYDKEIGKCVVKNISISMEVEGDICTKN